MLGRSHKSVSGKKGNKAQSSQKSGYFHSRNAGGGPHLGSALYQVGVGVNLVKL